MNTKNSFLILIFCLCTHANHAQQIASHRKYFLFADANFEVGEVKILSNVYYDYDDGTLRPFSFSSLDSVIDFLKSHPTLSVEIGSHTDSKGKDEYNLKLSEARANSVYQYLKSKGTDPAQISYKGYGETLPLVSNTNADGTDCESCRQQNRRTEITITKIFPANYYKLNGDVPDDPMKKNK